MLGRLQADHPQLPTDPHPVWLAHALAGGYGDPLSQALYHLLQAEAARRLDSDPGDWWGLQAHQAAAELSAFLDGTATQRRAHMQAARNKFHTLQNLDCWWDRSRPAICWETIIGGHQNVVVNFAASATGWEPSPDGEGRVLAGMLLYRLRQVIATHCDGWQQQNRWVSIFTDELAQQVGSQPEVVAWLKDEGRAFGVRLFAATQRLAQLDTRVRDVLLTFETLVCFRMKQARAADDVARELSSASDEWATHDVQNLPPYHAAVRTAWQRRLLSTFVTEIPEYDTDPAGWTRRWGYQPATDGNGGDDPAAGCTAGRAGGATSAAPQTAAGGPGPSWQHVADNIPEVPL